MADVFHSDKLYGRSSGANDMTTTPINTTKEGIEVKPGQVWKDLDGRTQGPNGDPRTCTVTVVRDGVALMSVDGVQPYRTTHVAIRRMHKSATGWALVSEVV